MRTTIACQRASKVKCKHNGQEPCLGCRKSGNTQTCVLTGPILSQKHKTSPRTRGLKRKRSTPADKSDGVDTTTDGCMGDVAREFDQIPQDLFTKAIAIFQAQFPEFGFLHPNDLDFRSEELRLVQKLRLLALLAVSGRYMDDASTALARQCASVVTYELHQRITSAPELCIIQTFLIMSLYDWGEGEGFSAWMHAGIASRMAQGGLSMNPSATGRRPLSEIEKRTVWTCFVMDKLLSCGRRRQEIFNMETMDVPLPLNDADFVFGPNNTLEGSPNQFSYPPPRLYGTGDYFLVILRGLHIWSKVHSWTVSGGRKQPGMTEPDECPWNSTSTWHRMKQELLGWRALQASQLKYPETRAVSHVHLRQAERFGYINLIYYVSLAFLGREYIPFVPPSGTRPRGPVERPLLKAIGPDSFWEQNVADVYYAGTQISNLLRDLRLAGCQIQTPFTGLCAFTSGLISLYAAAFPSFVGFSPDETKAAERQAQESLSDLHRIGKVWKLAQEWITVLDTAKGLFSRVNTTSSRPVRSSRYDYPELEDSMNLAPLKGMPINTAAPVQAVQGDGGEGAGDVTQAERLGDGVETISGLGFLEGDEAMDEDEWRLWSFWGDPHLLSTFGEQGG